MSEWEDKLNAILSSPETMEQIMALAGSLSGGGEAAQETGQSAPEPNLGALLGGIDPALVGRLLPLLQEYNAKGDEKQALLQALKPFLSEESQERVEQALRITRLSRVIRGSMKLFGGNEHV